MKVVGAINAYMEGPIWKDLMTGPGGAVAFPAMTLLVVSGLLDPAAKLEIDASAIIHD